MVRQPTAAAGTAAAPAKYAVRGAGRLALAGVPLQPASAARRG